LFYQQPVRPPTLQNWGTLGGGHVSFLSGLGYLHHTDKGWNFYMVNKFMPWIDDMPAELSEGLDFPVELVGLEYKISEYLSFSLSGSTKSKQD